MTAFLLKTIAALTMLIDHMGLFLFPKLTWMRIVGRFAFPIYAFLAAEGVAHTRSKPKYLLRLGICAAAAEVVYDLCLTGKPFSEKYQCTIWTLIVGILCCMLWDRCRKNRRNPVLPLLVTGLAGILAELLHFDYGVFGVLLVFLFYLCGKVSSPELRTVLQTLSLAGCIVGLFIIYKWAVLFFAILAAIPLCLYNGRRGIKLPFYIFYVYYPFHLLVLYILRLLLH